MAANVMRKVSLRSLAAHKLRLLLTVFSVVLGTSFVAAAVVFTSSVQHSFNSIFDNVAKGVSAEVTAADPRSPGVPLAVVDQLNAQQGALGVAKTEVNYSGLVTLAKSDGSALQTGGAPSVGSAYVPPDQAVSDSGMKIVAGRAPAAPGEVAVNTGAADKAGLKVGSTTRVALGAGTTEPLDVTVVGLLDMPAATGGYTNVQFTQDQARQLFSGGGYVSTVDLAAAPGVSDTALRDKVAAALNQKGPDGKLLYEVRTGEQVREDQKAQVATFLNIFRYILLAFAAIGLVVGTFIIYNTFSMIVAQRNRELALLRAVGASRKNVSRSVLLEALVVGLLGGAIGLGLGIGIAALMRAATAGSGLPAGPLQVGLSAILSALFVGVIVTMLSAWIPARRASRIPPVEAMRSAAAEPGAGSLRRRTIAAVALGVAGVLILVGSWFIEGAGALALVGLAALLVIVAVVLGAPALSQPVVGGIGRVLQAPFGTVGKLARTNALRNPRRSAATAFALTIGLMLVVLIGTLGWSLKGEINAGIDDQVSADYIVSGTGGAPLSSAAGKAVAAVPDAATVVSFDVTSAKLDGVDTSVSTPVGTSLDQVLNLKMTTGSSQISPDGMVISRTVSENKGWKPGTVVTFASTTGVAVPATVSGIYEPNAVVGDWLLGNGVFDKLVPSDTSRMTMATLVKTKPGVSEATMRDELEKAVKPYLTAQVQDRQQFKNGFSSIIDSMLATLYALLGLALVIAVLGIINTLALSVVERRQEIGMLRAIGTTRAQLRRTIYLESIYIAIFGALLGVVIGLVIGLPLVHGLRHWGLEHTVIPWSLIVVTLVGAAIVGGLAALWPAVSAARTKPLEAIVES
ncbi:MAG: ABC transporter permease [Gordonia sp. (in: high G+C Gram-positive bacteria)]|uniref:ABC transporter permease n=1 Tax=Gordonia sp. (in: high G+C Gram-positive bacteria) TaxID=84139 RepID=UPI0039E511E7